MSRATSGSRYKRSFGPCLEALLIRITYVREVKVESEHYFRSTIQRLPGALGSRSVTDVTVIPTAGTTTKAGFETGRYSWFPASQAYNDTAWRSYFASGSERRFFPLAGGDHDTSNVKHVSRFRSACAILEWMHMLGTCRSAFHRGTFSSPCGDEGEQDRA